MREPGAGYPTVRDLDSRSGTSIKDWIVVARQTGRDAAHHLVEVHRRVAVLAARSKRGQARHGRHAQLRLEAGGDRLGGNSSLDGQHAAVDQEDIAVEAGALVVSAHVLDDAANADRPASSSCM